jgi:hypothetical protein
MKPNRAGIWEWFDKDGTKRLVAVYNTEHNPQCPPHLRVYWWGGYYNVNDEHEAEHPEWDWASAAEWADRWGNYVAPHGCFGDEELYLGPTPDQAEEIKKEYENQP